jgi:hypothetical protein
MIYFVNWGRGSTALLHISWYDAAGKLCKIMFLICHIKIIYMILNLNIRIIYFKIYTISTW